ncbi:MAG: gluconokinase [Chloroflexi bacterium]|nr:gluconokinase [Chloroflexota bacterium]
MIIILMGVAGSGKTTIGTLLACELGWDFLDADDFHPASNLLKMGQNIPLTDSDRAGWLASLQTIIEERSRNGHSLVLACSALKKKYRDKLRINDYVRFVHLQGTFQQIKERLQKRAGHFMSAKMLASQFEILEEPADALIVDIGRTPLEIISIIRTGFNI